MRSCLSKPCVIDLVLKCSCAGIFYELLIELPEDRMSKQDWLLQWKP